MPKYRDDVYATMAKSTDRIGRQNPRLLISFATFMRSIPGWAEQWRGIPDEFWAKDVTDDGLGVAEVSCPCGKTPMIEAGCTVQCSCERIFFFSGRGVLVANSPRDAEPVATPVEPEDPFFANG